MYSSYCKKKNRHAKFLYATHLSPPSWLKRFNIFKNLFLSEYLKKGILGAFKYLASTFYLFVLINYVDALINYIFIFAQSVKI